MHPLTSAAPACPDAFCWQQAMAGLKKALRDRHVHPANAVVLLPYAQLMQRARKAWAAHGAGAQDGQHAETAVFVPRFETTMNWASSLGGRLGPFVPTGTDLQMDVAVDTLTAASLLHKAGLGNQQDVLASRLVEAAWSLARVAAAVPPGDRVAWGERLAPLLSADLESPALAREAALGRIALAWAATSSYPTDRLFEARPVFLAV
ncbi:MAG: exonuclease, partial [Polaromonas sp. 35-63-240]